MKLLLAAVGRAKKSPERALFEHYAGRVKGGLPLIEVEEKRPLPTPERMTREAELLLAQVPPGACLVALDERGESWTSERLAQEIEKRKMEARPAIVFAIGGADGHGEALKQRADVLLNLGKMVWPHMLARAMVAEQIYRAQCIIEGHPYHRA